MHDAWRVGSVAVVNRAPIRTETVDLSTTTCDLESSNCAWGCSRECRARAVIAGTRLLPQSLPLDLELYKTRIHQARLRRVSLVWCQGSSRSGPFE